MKKFTQKLLGIAALFFALSLSSNAQEIGDQAEGGTVFHIDEASGLGYVVASQDLSSGAYDTSQPGDLGYEWGCYGVNVSTDLTIGSGESNTESIASNCSSPNGITAAQAVLNHSSGGYDDWFLPSRDEFLAMTSFEDFNDGWYFSSSQYSSTTQAWFVAPNNDDQNASSKKIFTLQVRPIRTFDWSPLVVAECGNQMDGTSRSSGESCMPCVSGTFSPDDLSDCLSVSECYLDEYETMAPTPTSDRECSVLSTCLSDEFVSMAATTTSDRLCSPIRTICASDEYVSVAASPGLFDIQCSPVRTSCSSGEFVSVAALPGLSDIECSELSDCTAGEYESMAPTATSDRACSALSVCSFDQYESIAPTANSDRICEIIVEGCIDATAYNYDANANTDDNSCVAVVNGCTDSSAFNYHANANTDNGSCNALSFPKGWSMFGYTCLEAKDVVAAFEGHKDQIEIVKDEWGLAYLPSYEFNALGDLIYMEGYQIKVDEALVGLKFCDMITPEDGVTQADVDAAVAAVHATYEGWCASDLDNDGICDVDEVSGCMDETACNYNSEAEFGDDSCENTSCIDACGVMNGDGSSCLDCAGVPNGSAEDLGCGCGEPAAQEGYDCAGNSLTPLQIGDIHAGGYVFKINGDGTGLVADLQDLGKMTWQPAKSAALNATSQGYDDWYLPSKQELLLMYATIGKGSGSNPGGFINEWYWSIDQAGHNSLAWVVGFFNGSSTYADMNIATYSVRAIRAF
ncbi:DUF1566 domain-containing protein [Flavobacteriales bacterium]|nr:DUF1566 domain-containing protein [Flavobacteriales bacterium]